VRQERGAQDLHWCKALTLYVGGKKKEEKENKIVIFSTEGTGERLTRSEGGQKPSITEWGGGGSAKKDVFWKKKKPTRKRKG